MIRDCTNAGEYSIYDVIYVNGLCFGAIVFVLRFRLGIQQVFYSSNGLSLITPLPTCSALFRVGFRRGFE